MASLLVPSVAHASGNWDGIGLIVGLWAAPIVLIVLMVQGVALSAARRRGVRVGVGVGSLLVTLLCAAWQVFYFALELVGSELFERLASLWVGSLMAFGAIVMDLVALVLGVLLLRRPRSSEPDGGAAA